MLERREDKIASRPPLEEKLRLRMELGYNSQNRESSSKLTSTAFAQTVEEKTSDETIQLGETSSNPPQTLDQNYLTYHLHHHHHFPHSRQLNPPPEISSKYSGDPHPNRPDLGPAPTGPLAERLNTKTPSQPGTSTSLAISSPVRYRECLKNHAASMGGYVLDGCGEFMPDGEKNSREGLKCAACDCHRNFHRKETEGEPPVPSSVNCHYPYSSNNTPRQRSDQRMVPPHSHLHHQGPLSLGPPAPMMMAFGSSGGAAAESSSEDLAMGHQPQSSKKRFRTKFTNEQKDKMMEFAEKLGWKIHKHDEEEVQQFCAEAGLKRQVLKVWMHNNKPAIKKHQM